MKTRRSRLNIGMTLVEVLVASGISSIVLGSAISIFLMVTSSWAKGESQMSVENETRQTMRLMADELREAMWVSVDADGMGITYRKPVKSVTGDFTVPITWDGKDRRLYYSGGKLFIEPDTGQARLVCRNVLTKDPFALATNGAAAQLGTGDVETTGAPAYKIFTANAGSVTTEITMVVVTGNKGGKAGQVVRAKKRETVVLRNVPELIR